MKSGILIFGLMIIIHSCTSIDNSKIADEFITVEGTKFIKGNLPYYFVGTNLWFGCYMGSPGKTGNRERLRYELDKLRSLNIDNLRILAASEESTITKSLKPAIQKSPGIYDEDLLVGLDYLLSEMSKRDMYAVIFLNNYWEWSGGMGQYVAWANNENPIDPDDFSELWEEYNIYVNSFYRNDLAQEYFKNFIKLIVTRKNTITGKYYFNDPTIMSWQLANEPRPGNGKDAEENIGHYYKWIDETAAFIKNLDPNHLVTTGNEGLMGSNGSEEFYLNAHKFRNIDYMTFHLWAKNWGWFDANKIEETYSLTEKNAIDYINKHLNFARKLNKPITLEEFGLPRDWEYTLRGTLISARDRYFKMIFNIVEDSLKAGASIAGTNFWAWGGDGFKKQSNSIWKIGDPFTGDPPQEPQGLNSVFNTDYSTLKLIKEHGQNMIDLRSSTK